MLLRPSWSELLTFECLLLNELLLPTGCLLRSECLVPLLLTAVESVSILLELNLPGTLEYDNSR